MSLERAMSSEKEISEWAGVAQWRRFKPSYGLVKGREEWGA